jgi:undecaprenyl diphosphate synthase
MSFSRLPRHLGIIPDGNRRWAEARGQPRRAGYSPGVEAGFRMLELGRELGIHEVSLYGFTRENVRRPTDQVEAFREACVEFALEAVRRGVALLVVGDTDSHVFPDPLRPFTETRTPGDLRVNMLVNYGWRWDIGALFGTDCSGQQGPASLPSALGSGQVSRIDLVVRWGGRCRLSGFLPVQCAYADLFVIDTLWPDMQAKELLDALHWYQEQDVTLGG